MPDGFGELVNHNLLSFKSHREALTVWALQELLGHYVSYRKLVSAAPNDLLPERHFRLLAFCVRYPQQLATQVPLRNCGEGFYDCDGLGMPIRVIVAHQLPQAERNALCHLFSASPDQIGYAATHYNQRSPRTSTMLLDLLKHYREEGFVMANIVEEYCREVRQRMLHELTSEERKQVLREMTSEEREQFFREMMSEERSHGLRPEEILKALPPEEIKRYLRSVEEQPPAAPKANGNGAETTEF